MFTLIPAATQVQRRICWIALACVSVLVHAAPKDVELIPRKALFGDPVRAGLVVSPDGKYLAWLAPHHGVMNIWVAPVAQPHRGKPITAQIDQPLREYTWAPGSDRIMYSRYDAKQQRHLLVGQPVQGGKAVIYASSEKAPPRIIGTSPLVRDAILIALGDRHPDFPDAYRLNLGSGELVLVRQNEGWSEWLIDMQLNLRGGIRHDGAIGFDVYRFDGGQFLQVMRLESEDVFIHQFAFDADGRTLFALSSQNRNRRALVAVDFATGASKIIGEHGRADAVFFLTHPATGKPSAFDANYLRQEWTAVGEASKADFAFLAERFADGFLILSQSDDDRLWTLRDNDLSQRYHLYDRRNRKLVQLFSRHQALARRRAAPTHPVEIRTRDGLTLVAYLTLPPGSDRTGKGRPDRPLPLILTLSDHVWGRVHFGPDSRSQWLANRGYAVLAINQRGALGFGKAFLNAGDHETGGKRLDDVIDAANWVVKENIAPAEKIAMMGAHYGGHVTLMALATAPEAFACGVNMRGATNLVPVIESPRNPVLAALFRAKIGDPRTEEGRRRLLAESPLTHSSSVQRPLLITFPGKAPWVRQGDFDEVVAKLQANNVPVTYAHFGDDGEDKMQMRNRLSEYAVVEAFLSRCLGGRYEPIGDDFRGSSIEIKAGLDYVPGLARAVAARQQ